MTMMQSASTNQRATPASHFAYYESPVGLIELGATPDALTALYFIEAPRRETTVTPLLTAAVQQLAAYFAGALREFSIPLHFQGTPFQQQVWQQLLTVPYGKTTSYQAIANALGNPKAGRAVGAANGQNPISIMAPCHRIIGSDGALTGYGGGLWRKEWLLRHEGYLLV
jgi:methylated-DNA-[protein]-cysteine S-methyltransferase